MHLRVAILSGIIAVAATAMPSGSPEGFSGDLLVDSLIADCRQPKPVRRFQAPDGYRYDYQCKSGAPRKIRRFDETSRERIPFDLAPSLFDGQWRLRPAPSTSPCGPGSGTHHINTEVGWGRLSANCNGAVLEGRFLYRVGESTEEEGNFHQGVLDGDFVQYQRLPIGKHRPERRETRRASYRMGALDGITRVTDANGAYVELPYHDGVLQGVRQAGHSTVESETAYAEGRLHGARRVGTLLSTYQNGILEKTNDPAERAASRTQTEEDPDGWLFLEDAHDVALACPPPPPTVPFTGHGERWDYHCDEDQVMGAVRYYRDGFLRLDLQVKSGKLDGPFRAYADGMLRTEGEFRSGRADGVFRRYDQGMLIAEKKFKNGKPEKKTKVYRSSPAGQALGTLEGMRAACDSGQVTACQRAGEAARAAGFADAAEPFFQKACALDSGIGCASAANAAYRHLDFALGTEAIKKARRLMAEDDLVRWVANEIHLDPTAARGAMGNVLAPGRADVVPANYGGERQHEVLRRISSRKPGRAVKLDVEKVAKARAPHTWNCHEGDRLRLAVFRCTWPAPLEWHGAGLSGLTEAATCLTPGLTLGGALSAATVVAEHETLAKLPPLFPEAKPAALWRKATVIGCDDSVKPTRPVVTLD